MNSSDFGKYIKDLRKLTGMSIRQLSMYSGVSNSYLSQIENGKRDIPKPEILKKLSPYLKVSYEELMFNAGYIEKNETTAKSNSEELTKRDLKSIEKDLQKMMEEIKTNPNEGFAAYGGEIDEEDLELLENAFRTALTVVKKLNKETYTPKKYKKK